MLGSFLSKVKYIAQEEGFEILAKRMSRYLFYLVNRVTRTSKNDIQKWDQLKGKFKGKRAFLIGNGPSLNKTPLHLLANEFTICFNRFDLMLERLCWNPTAYSVIDDVVLDDVPDIANKMSEKVEYAFFQDFHPSAPLNTNFKRTITDRDNIFWLHLDKANFSNV